MYPGQLAGIDMLVLWAALMPALRQGEEAGCHRAAHNEEGGAGGSETGRGAGSSQGGRDGPDGAQYHSSFAEDCAKRGAGG
eukprot:scaffold119357_cov25-Prasinocladus_malaysianus.AAC.1